MSNWMKLKTQIKNLDSLKKACDELNLFYIPIDKGRVVAKLEDKETGGPTYSRYANVCKEQDYYIIEGDTDQHYSSLAKRLGSDYGKLLQCYAKHEIMNNVMAQGGMITQQVEKADGSLVLRVSI